MNRPYKNLKTVFIVNGAGYEFQKNINVPFNVNEIVLKSYTARDYDAVDNPNMSILTSPLVNGTLLSVNSGIDMPVFVNSQFIGPHTPINGTFNFRWYQLDGSELIDRNNFELNIVFQLVFIEY
jgi:hypothetical protein